MPMTSNMMQPILHPTVTPTITPMEEYFVDEAGMGDCWVCGDGEGTILEERGEVELSGDFGEEAGRQAGLPFRALIVWLERQTGQM